MECFTIRNLTFSYPEQAANTIDGLNLSFKQGEFIALIGPSGSGKSTLLRQLKSVLAPHGKLDGDILFEGRPLAEVSQREQSARIGFVMQNPDNQIVTDKVWHELAFGLESLGYSTSEIRVRVAEMTSFFGIQSWFYKNVSDLSGGQKQLLNLASIMAMQPSELILDEPTSQLDPIAAADFLATVGKINRELGTTVIMTEHRLEEVFPMSDRVLVIDHGRLLCDGSANEVGDELKKVGHSMFLSLPTPMRIHAAVPNSQSCPVTVRDGRLWLDEYSSGHPVHMAGGQMPEGSCERRGQQPGTPIVELNDLWFKYEKDSVDVVKGLSLKVHKGEFLAILGGNGTGKTTALSLVSGINRPYRGKVLLEGSLGVLPQNPQALFVKKTVREDLQEILKKSSLSNDDKNRKIGSIARLCRIEALLDRHPYDLSGGEQQRAALAKVLLLEPRVLLLDEPTKGLDAEFKGVFAGILERLLRCGVSIVMVSHDIEFCARHAHRCAMFFDGNIVTEGVPGEFFSGNSFYTTAANRMSRHLLPTAVTAEDVITACGGHVPDPEPIKEDDDFSPHADSGLPEERQGELQRNGQASLGDVQVQAGKRRLSKRTLLAAAMILLAVPLTIYIGIFYLGDRKYYFISMLIIFEIMLPFLLVFEGRKPQARELVIISVLCAIGVAGRTAFFMLPQFKPVAALVIISGVAFGGETGFLVGGVTMLVSNIIFGQGPWTPWQMFAMGIIGFLSGVLFRKGVLLRSRLPLCIFGGLATVVIYGGLMNPSSILMYNNNPSWQMLMSAYLMGFPFDLIHGCATVIFLWFVSQPMLEKLDRIKVKYGLLE
jgi:energy-coupling factor transport system ATP-binding protein